MMNPTSKNQEKRQIKAAKKYYKKTLNLLQEYDAITVSDSPTQCLFIGNGGMFCGMSREALLTIFGKYGSIVDLVMLPKKSFAFVMFSSVVSAEEAFGNLDGYIPTNHSSTTAPQSVSPFYLKFINSKSLEFAKKEVSGAVYPIEGGELRIVSGLSLLEDFISGGYEQKLFDFFQEKCLSQQVGENILKHRNVLHYGYKFLYGSNNIDKEQPLNQGIPDICKQLVEKMVDQGVIEWYPDQMTVNQYHPGQGIPPHIDTHSAFEDGIISLTLNSQVTMDFTDPEENSLPVLLPTRSLLVMKGESRYLWSHGITPRKFDIVYSKKATKEENHLTMRERGIRISLTFRKILRKPCKCKYSSKCDSQIEDLTKQSWIVPSSQNEASTLEGELVYKVYEEIAEHFSDTRHSPWPRVKNFLCNLPNNSIVADVGCGNGKYLGVNKKLMMLGSDRSVNLAGICEERGHQVIVSDCLKLPYRSCSFDGCICIAVIHHLSTEERRIEAVKELVRLVRIGGLVLIYVWALEQTLDENEIDVSIERLNIREHRDIKGSETEIKDTKERAESASCHTQDEKQFIQVAEGRNTFQQQDLLVPWHLKNNNKNADDSKHEEQVFHRFYHVFKQGELRNLCNHISNVNIQDLYLDRGNWCIILEKIAN